MNRYFPFVSEAAKARYTARYREEEARWPLPFTGRFVETPEGRTYRRVCGPADAPPLVLLPGLTTPSLLWAPNAAAWGRSFRLYTPDMIYDAGLSVNAAPVWRRRTLLSWLSHLFGALSLRRPFALAGMSYGGWLAAEYALAYPEDVSRLVLLAPAAAVRPLRPRFLAAAAACLFFPRLFADRYFRWMFADSLARPGAMTFAEFQEGARLRLSSFRLRVPALPRVFTDGELARLPQTLFLMGEHDRLCNPFAAARRLRAACPHAEARVLPGAGHDLPVVAAGRVNALVLDFLKK